MLNSNEERPPGEKRPWADFDVSAEPKRQAIQWPEYPLYVCGHHHALREDAVACWNAQGRPLP